jgi:hypothetical protein
MHCAESAAVVIDECKGGAVLFYIRNMSFCDVVAEC